MAARGECDVTQESAPSVPADPKTERHPPGTFVPVSRWGKDHWSTLAYIECRIVDHKGVPSRAHMRTDADLHPGLAGHTEHGVLTRTKEDRKYPTRLYDWTQLFDHDDWSCLEDAEEAHFLTSHGTGINPVYALTDRGRKVCAALRAHKGAGGQFATFVCPSLAELDAK